jgi:hypothetical protein
MTWRSSLLLLRGAKQVGKWFFLLKIQKLNGRFCRKGLLEKKGDFYLCHFVGEEKWPKK